ncbi:type III PLP-dependent enzyme domain-containing protein [Adhaeribacter soli]|uniref:Arginine decarboxylase n=1 Tax=Adhaeribacter soli TaxID=2607655 RepID=A0A5N1IN84_9BACT|nr:arginine decarboxylase [Adhaeribacter soli]KAA9324940.1 arginine decarboxylase [Adhaeribacter soli]
MDKYIDLINQTFDFPTEEFRVENNELFFNEIPMMEIVKEYGTPLRLTYLPKISSQIKKAKLLFKESMEKLNYQGSYTYCYCTKSSHFSFVLEEALKNNIHIETSSSFDIPIIRSLYEKGKVDKNIFVVCNGYKRELYRQYITEMINDGFKNVTPVIDNLEEIDHYDLHVTEPCQLGIRVASDEEPKFQFYTSRLGINYSDVVKLYKKKIKDNPKFQLKMLHYFINTGIKDTSYYWSELSRFVHKYCELKKICPELDTIDIGGGFPIKTSIQFDYNYRYMIEEILRTIQRICKEEEVPEPNIFTEFGIYTVGESGAHVYSILDTKLQNDKELWYMIDGSFITNLPDTWALNQRYILMAINQWDKPYQRLNLGGLTCDSQDYYNSEMHSFQVFLPKVKKEQEEPLYIGFFHTGAYQESLSGYGGIKHCLIPSPKHVIIDREEDGTLKTWLFAEEQTQESMLKILGY